ncbi:MAG: hypothetical protein H6622_02435 [Halobacteriovoraceae bacterium]|nr:hypothetical protein [Halobacteriovoraceae bacterium]
MFKSMRLTLISISLILLFKSALAKDFIIYSIVQDIPMGEPNEIVKKNYYVNLGKGQGVNQGTVLNVYRQISRIDAYESKQRFNYNIKIGELKVIHSEDSSSIGLIQNFRDQKDDPLFEISGLMIGDKVDVKIE